MKTTRRYCFLTLGLLAGFLAGQAMSSQAAAPKYKIIANDAPRFVGDMPYRQRGEPAAATMKTPVELTAVSPYAYPERHKGEWRVDKTELMYIKNDQVEVGLAPDIGGSILVHRLLSTGDNYFKFVEENLNLRNTVWMDWGGFCDLGFGRFWGEPFYLKKYDCRIVEKDGIKSIIGKVASGPVELTRTCTIREGSTSLTIETIQKNVGKYPTTLEVFNHPTLQLGKENDEDDLFFGLMNGALFRKNYVVGEETWHATDVAAGWAAVTDPNEKKAWIKVFGPAQTAAVGFWPSQNMGHYYVDQTIETREFPMFQYYNAETLSKTKEAKPGESLAFRETYFLVDGLPEVHFVASMVAGCLLIQTPLVSNRDELETEIGAGSDARRSGVAGELRILDAAGTVIHRQAVAVGDLTPGKANVKSVRVPLSGRADGKYALEFAVTVDGKSGASRAPFQIDTPAVGQTLSERDRVKGQVQSLSSRLAEAKRAGRDVLSQEGDIAVTSVRLEKAEKAIARRQYAEAAEHLQEAKRRVERVESAVQP